MSIPRRPCSPPTVTLVYPARRLMMKRTIVSALVMAGCCLPAAAAAQGFGVGGRIGVFGLGPEVTYDHARIIAVRAGVGSVPVHPTAKMSDADVKIDLPSTLDNVGLDVYPGRHKFRLSGGLLFKHDIVLEATPTQNIDFNHHTYTPAQVGSLKGTYAFSSTAPYATLGFAGHGKGFGAFVDLGAAFLGTPTVKLQSTGPCATNTQCQIDMRAEEQKQQTDAGKVLKALPLLSMGLRFGL